MCSASAGEFGARWQGSSGDSWSTAVVLRCVLPWLGARELWRCGSVCRAWRRAAADQQLWRKLLQPHARPSAVAAQAYLAQISTLNGSEEIPESEGSWWRRQYEMSTARWYRRTTLAAAESASLSCIALQKKTSVLALVRDDARMTIWSLTEDLDSGLEVDDAQPQWRERWNGVASAEWRTATLAHWAPGTNRLMVAGPLSLVDRHEIIIIEFEEAEKWRARIVCRAASSAGAGGCWVDDHSFLSMELRLLAPGQACSTLWLNAATQETQSEYTGVTSPLLRIYNESAAHITHVMVVESSSEGTQNNTSEMVLPDLTIPTAAYYEAQLLEQESKRQENTRKNKRTRILIAAGGAASGPKGEARALLMWPLNTPLVLPVVYVEDELAERVRRRRAQRSPEPELAPNESTVRALCTPPAAVCPLPGLVLGLVLHPSGRCIWASTSGGWACVSVPALRLLLWVPLQTSVGEMGPAYYVQPSANEHIFITPVGRNSTRVVTWLMQGGAYGQPLEARSPVLAAQLLPQPYSYPQTVLLLTVDALEAENRDATERGHTGMALQYSSRALRQLTHRVSKKEVYGRKRYTNGTGAEKNVRTDTGSERRTSCTPTSKPPCPPCERHPPPPCRELEKTCPTAVRVVCCAPAAGQRPPCPPPPSPQSLTCQNSLHKGKTLTECPACPTLTTPPSGQCGALLDRVALRLATAEQARRCDYEQEVASCIPPAALVAKPYRLAAERKCLRATDGKDYTVVDSAPPPTNKCGPCRTPPPPCPVKLDTSADCEIDRASHLDPCAHQPKVFVEIDRTPPSAVQPKPCPPENKPSKTSERLTTRIIEKLRRSNSSTVPAQSKEIKKDSWCNSPPAIKSVPPPCAQPSLVERIRQRPGGTCGHACNSRRDIHTKAKNPCGSGLTKKNEGNDKTENKTEGALQKVLDEKNNLNEAGRGRVAGTDCKKSKSETMGLGCLELPIPPSADRVRVHVHLNFNTVEKSPQCSGSVQPGTPYSPTLCSGGQRDSWLSLKNIQKKLSGCRKPESAPGPNVSSQESSSKTKNAACPTAPPSPCAGLAPPNKAQTDKPKCPYKPKCPNNLKFSSSDTYVDFHSPHIHCSNLRLLYLLNTI